MTVSMIRSLFLGASISAMAAAVGEFAECAAPLDIVFLQEATQTHEDDLPIILEQMPSLVNAIKAEFPGTYFGLASFRDKPVDPFGLPDDYIYRLHSGLTLNDTQFMEAWKSVAAAGGEDSGQDQYEALLAVVQDPLVGWHTKGEEIEAGDVRAHIIVLVTDSTVHTVTTGPNDCPSIDWQAPDGIVSADDVANPLVKDYPAWQHVRDAVKSEAGNYILFLVTEGRRPTWNWVNGSGNMKQPDGFIQTLSDDSNNFQTVLMDALKSFAAYHCELYPPQTTTTTEETTTVVTTPKVTTPQVTTPKVTTPKVTTPEITTPKVTTPRVTTPAIGDSGECATPIDVVFLQDATDTYIEDLPIVLEQMPSLVDAIRREYPGSYFGLASFRDKPVAPFGYDNDYIYRLHSGLTLNDTQFEEAWQTVAAGGGNDQSEDTYEAMLATLQDPLMGWHTKGEDIEAGDVRAHIIVLLTDAGTHLAGDGPAKVPSIDWQTHDGIVSADDVANPLVKDYPSWEQVRDAVKTEAKNYVLFLVTDDVKDVWTWANGPDMLDQPAEFVQSLSTGSNNLQSVVMDALRAFTAYHCELYPGGDQCDCCSEGGVCSGQSESMTHLVKTIGAEIIEELEAEGHL